MRRGYIVRVHFNRQRNNWTVHYKGMCIPAKVVVFNLQCHTVHKPDKKSNPRAWLETRGIVETSTTGVVTIWSARAVWPSS